MSTREDHLLQLCGVPINQAGVVRHIAAGGLATVVLPQGEIEARQAASCLLAPRAGDRVWLSGDLEQGGPRAAASRGPPARWRCVPGR